MIRKTDLKENFSNERIENAIKNILIENSNENQNTLINEMMDTYLYTLVDICAEDEGKEKGVKLLITIENKETFLPVFTSIEEMKDAKEKCNFEEVLIDFDEISNIVLDKTTDFKGFIINPASDNIIIEDELIRYIIEKNKEKYKDSKINIKANEELKIYEFDDEDYPKDMIDALISHFKKEKNINKSYIRFLNHNNENSYLLITDFSGDKDATFSKISEIARPFLKDMFLDQLEYDTQFGAEATKDIKPFYKKKVFGII